MLHVQDKGTANHSYYVTEGWGLTINSFTANGQGFIKDWNLVGPEQSYYGNSQKALFDLLENIKAKYNLQTFNANSKQILVIYTDNIIKAQGFTQPIITDQSFSYYFQVLENIEFRACWRDDLVDAKDIAEWAQVIIDTVFIPDKKFYLTGSQLTRIRARSIECLRSYYEMIAPRTWPGFDWYRKAVFGGCYYCPYPKAYWDDPMLGYDLVSAYIYCICCRKHCMSKEQQIYFTNEWVDYLDNEEYGSIGQYTISYKCKSNLINMFKDIEGNHLTKSKYDDFNEATIRACSVDMRLLIQICEAYEIKCTELYIYKMDYLPKDYIELVLKDFITKNNDKYGNPYKYKNDKIILNSHYGNTIPKWDNNNRWKAEDKKAVLPIQWGIFTTAYCREILYTCGRCIDGWRYSAVDSIKCADNEYNKAVINEFNKAIQADTKAMCDALGFDYEEIKALGTFDLEDHITKFKEWAPNQYAYISEEKGTVIKASGCDKKQIPENLDIFNLDKIPGGIRVTGDISKKKASIELDGIKYKSDGYYYESTDDLDKPIERLRYNLRWLSMQ